MLAIDGEIAAFLAATRSGDRLHVDEVDVRQDQQGRGLGRRLFEHIKTWARTEGFRSLSLTTFRSVPWNGPFYASLGFAEDESLPALQEILHREAAKGLSDRCAMTLRL